MLRPKPSRGALVALLWGGGTSWVMPWINNDTKANLAKVLKQSTPSLSICPCDDVVTIAIQPKQLRHRDISRSIFEADIVPFGGYLSEEIKRKYHNQKHCSHDGISTVKVVVNPWKTEKLNCDETVLLYNAKVRKTDADTIFVDASGIQTGILSIGEAIDDDHQIRCAEMFAGGFSGWSHSTTALSTCHYPMKHVWVVDVDNIAIDTYTKSHAGTVHLRSCRETAEFLHEDFETHSQQCLAFQCNVNDPWFLTYTKANEIDIMAWSPPCQPWSWAHTSMGLNVHDGMVWVHALTLIAHLRPKIFILEEVIQFLKHDQYEIILDLIHWSGYDIVTTQSLNLKQVLPQNRERCIIVAVDRFSSRVAKVLNWEQWSVTPAISIWNSRVIMNYDDSTMRKLIPSKETMAMYMDPRLLPKQSSDAKATKVTMKDVRQYRFKSLDDRFFSCIMASYRKAHDLPLHVIGKGGLYGSFIFDGCLSRFLSTPEIFMMMGGISKGVFPHCMDAQSHLLGNCISVPHASIALINAVRLLHKAKCEASVQQQFADVFAQRICTDIISVTFSEEGITIRSKAEIATIIDPTCHIPTYVTMTLNTPTTRCEIQIHEGVNIMRALQVVMGPSIPNEIWITLTNGIKIPIIDTDIVHDAPINIWAALPSVLSLDDANFTKVDASFVVILTPLGIVIHRRLQGHLVHQVLTSMKELFPEMVGPNYQIVNPFGLPIELQQDCPNVVFCQNHLTHETFHWQSYDIGTFREKNEHLSMTTTWSKAFSFVKFMKFAGVHELLQCMGWSIMIVPTSVEQSHQVEIIIARKPGALAVPIQQMITCITTRMLIVCLPKSRQQSASTKHVCFKLWDSWVWDGFIDNDDHAGIFIDAWTFFSQVFGHPSELRLVTQGQRLTPETKFDMVHERNDSIRIYALLQLQGGGNKTDAILEVKNQLAVFMLNNGADLQETSHMLDTMCRSCGLHAMKTVASQEPKDAKILAMQQLCSSMNIKFPNMMKKQEDMNQKTKEWAKQKNLQTKPTVVAGQLTLIPEVFRNEDGTIPAVKTSVATGMSGVILLDYETAVPWVSESNVISSDECALLILGHRCPCGDSKKCFRTNIPVKTSNGQTAIVTACMHNVGQKQVKLHYDETKENVAVKEGTVIAITIFRDEVQDVEWSVIASQPVRFALQTLGFEEEAHFQGPPWGRSWISHP